MVKKVFHFEYLWLHRSRTTVIGSGSRAKECKKTRKVSKTKFSSVVYNTHGNISFFRAGDIHNKYLFIRYILHICE